VPSLTIKGISDDLLESLRRRAEANRRSLNSEVLFTIEASVGRRPVDSEAFLDRVRRRRERMNVSEISAEILNEMREEGRA
jgi:chromosomal replication initiation ATPase DnaA